MAAAETQTPCSNFQGLNFALIGASGYIAPRHLQAINDTGNRLIAAVDPHDSVGVLDRFFPGARFFIEIERFDRMLEKLRRQDDPDAIDYVSICSPNYLHDAHVRLALRNHAHAICEKPLVINPWNLDPLLDLEQEYGRRIHTVLQLRLHAAMPRLQESIEQKSDRAEVCLTYVTRRGLWYGVSWKGDEKKSGGVAMNIGIHFFDMLLWLFGDVDQSQVHLRTPTRIAGTLELERARVRWFLSVEGDDLPPGHLESGRTAFRSITVDGEEIDFSDGFTDLHTRVYEAILAGDGFGIEDARPSVDLVHGVRTGDIVAHTEARHPYLDGAVI